MSAFVLKLVAICSMLLDHSIKTLFYSQSAVTGIFGESMAWMYELVQAAAPLGRLAFPIFAFFVAEGCRRTHSAKRYVGRLLLFGAVSELPFRLTLLKMPWETAWPFWPLRLRNVFFTLAFGALACFLCGLLRKKGRPALAALCALPFAVLAEFLRTDYGFWGVLAIFAAYVFTEKEARLLALGGILTAIYLLKPALSRAQPVILGNDVQMWVFSLLALVLLAFYNGERGKHAKWAFYIFYPAHLILLYLTRYFLLQPNVFSPVN